MASWTLSDLAEIESAIRTGALRVKFADKDVTYRSLDDLLRARAIMRRELGLDEAGSSRSRASYDKDL